MELRIVKHEDHWHYGFVPDGDRVRVYAEDCNGFESRVQAIEAARENTIAEFDYGLAMGDTGRRDQRLALIDDVVAMEESMVYYPLGDKNPTTYSPALSRSPQLQFTIGQPVRPKSKGLSTDPGYEPNYRTGDPGVVESLSENGFKVGVRFKDGGFCIYSAFDLQARGA